VNIQSGIPTATTTIKSPKIIFYK